MRLFKYPAIRIFLLLFCVLFIINCAGWKSKAVTGYEAIGITLTEIKTEAEKQCLAGTLKSEDCEQIKGIYNKARLAYITAGNALIVAMNTEDTALKQKSMDAYLDAVNQVSQLSFELIDLAIKLGVKVQ